MANKLTLAQLKGQFGGADKDNEKRDFGTTKYYPFWNMKAGQRAVIRFLPDRDDTNPRGFLVEKVFHNLFINGAKKTVPCMSMYGEDCPVCKVSQDYYKAKDEVNGKKYWRKKQYIAQAVIVEDPLPPDAETGETHQGQVRYIALGYQLYNIIKEAFASEDDPLDAVPYDFNDGYDFIIKKTEQGNYSTYTMGTKFHSKQRGLSEEELVSVEDGMVELATLLPKNPGVEKVQAMLNADLNGDDYSDSGKDNEQFESAAPAVKKAAPKAKPAAMDDDDPPFEPTPKAAPAAKKAAPKVAADDETPSEVDDVLAQIRARRAAK